MVVADLKFLIKIKQNKTFVEDPKMNMLAIFVFQFFSRFRHCSHAHVGSYQYVKLCPVMVVWIYDSNQNIYFASDHEMAIPVRFWFNQVCRFWEKACIHLGTNEVPIVEFQYIKFFQPTDLKRYETRCRIILHLICDWLECLYKNTYYCVFSNDHFWQWNSWY